MRTSGGALVLPALAAVLAAGACLPGTGPAIDPHTDDAGTPPNTTFGDDVSNLTDVDLGPKFAVTGLQPSHGPWTGGTRTTIAGRGFASSVDVWIGGTQLAASDVFASDPTRITVTTPGGTPGPADVRVRNVSTADDVTLPAGFSYDAFVVTPSTGATTGGTRIALQGKGTHWTSASTVAVSGKPCTGLTFQDATDLSCNTPANDAGSVDVTVSNADGTLDRASDAFVYSDSPDGYRGGLTGGALAGHLTVLAFDNWTGVPIPGVAIAGSTLASAVVGTFDANGVASLSGPSLQGKVTVTVAAHCHQPITYVDVPVDTVTLYLDPTLSPACAQGEPPSPGNWFPSDDGEADGELVWSGGYENQRAAWGNVPMPANAKQHQVAYIFTPSSDPAQTFNLPSEMSATTPTSGGQVGYQYAAGGIYPGNITLYALAGIQDDSVSPPAFEPFAMGVASGVPIRPGTKTVGVDIPMTTLLDRTMTTVPQPPSATPRGPDRLVTTVSIALGPAGYAILPQGVQTSLLPVEGDVSFVGVPALDGTLAGMSYALTGSAVTGTSHGDPASIVQAVRTTDANDPLTLGGFFDVPVLQDPPASAWSGTHVALKASGPIDLALFTISSGGGLVDWQIVAPGSDLSFSLPDLSQVPNVDSLVRGPISTSFYIARITGFDYGTLRTGQLQTSAWNAYAEDVASGSY